MTIHLSKKRLAAAIVAVTMLIPATAFATHVFDDVPDRKFYAAPVEWAFDNGITTGKSPTRFAPDDNVTRGESVTFLKRYHDNLVQPGLDDLADGLEAQTVGLFGSATRLSSTTTLGDLGLSASVTIPAGHTGVIEVVYSAESACYNGGSGGWCKITLKNNGAPVGDGDFAFDSSDGGTEGSASYESHAMVRVTEELGAGTYVFTAESSLGNSNPTFRLDDMTLTATVHLTS
ncbi:MAG: S-layer homology domain-containing protein [Acidimicrobiales bacterium]